jgi:hypothetical protein
MALHLYFTTINTDEHMKQVQRTAVETKRECDTTAADRARAVALKPGPGRPPKPTTLLSRSPDAVTSNQTPTKRPRRINWFASPLIHHILEEFRVCGNSARKAVSNLQRRVPKLYTDLAASTVQTWFDEKHQLKPQYQAALDEQRTPKRGCGYPSLFAAYPQTERTIKELLASMRGAGATVNLHTARLVMLAVVKEDGLASVLDSHTLSRAWMCNWLRESMGFTWRRCTTAASKLPNDWRQQGVVFAKRIAAAMGRFKIHPSLIVNPDQTSLHLAPFSQFTYDENGAKSVRVIAAEDKRQITAVLASSMDGEMLPLQLIFQGKTPACLPQETPTMLASQMHVTFTANHWSSQDTMKQYIQHVIVPFRNRQIEKQKLPADSKLLLVLDSWCVHKSEEFRTYIRHEHSWIHLVFVPANCTSKLQVADVILQRPFKHGIRKHFNEWAASIIQEQVRNKQMDGLSGYMKMSIIKPLIVEWAIQSWMSMKTRKDLIGIGWHMCVSSLYKVSSVEAQLDAVSELYASDFKDEKEDEVEETHEGEESEASDDEEDESKDVLDVLATRVYGHRRTDRKRKEPDRTGFFLSPSQVDFAQTDSEDSDANGMD